MAPASIRSRAGAYCLQAEMKIAARKQCGCGLGIRKSANICAVCFQMVAARRTELYGQLRSAGARKLFSVDSRPQTITLASFENLF